MSQVSTEAFDFIFADQLKTESRIDRLQFRIDRAQKKLDKLAADPITNTQQRKIGRLEGLISAREGSVAALQSDLDEIVGFLPKDELNINYDPAVDADKFSISFQDSPYDDFFDGDDHIKLRIRGTSDNRRGWATVLGLNNPLYTGTKCILDDSVYTEAGFDVGRFIDKYDSVEVFVEVNGVEVKTVTIV